ncbi:MAG TPA: cation:proton antiporter [Pilimelia sp.]|nr:cation:proton antiporter [Pilimelia sp.]
MGTLLHLFVALTVVLLAAAAGRRLAQAVGQPAVVGEIAVGMLLAPAVIAVAGRDTYAAVLPDGVHEGLRLFGQAGLILFLVGVGHELRHWPAGRRGPELGWFVAGAFLLPLSLGLLFGAWVVTAAPPEVRGAAPAPGLVLLMAVAFAVTAVPVLARILLERRLTTTPVGRLAMTGATIIDVAAWLMLVLAITLASRGGPSAVLRAGAVLAAGLALAVLARRALSTAVVRRGCATAPRLAAIVIGGTGLLAATLSEHGGMTAIFGALLVGLAIPDDAGAARWSAVVGWVSRVGLALVPAFFVVAGAALLAGPVTGVPWLLTAVVVAIGCVGKLVGSYVGARLGGHPPSVGARLAVLMNTRGLTEIVVLQAGYQAGILTRDLLLALLAMALITTAMTGPLLSLLDRRAARRAPAPEPTPVAEPVG